MLETSAGADIYFPFFLVFKFIFFVGWLKVNIGKGLANMLVKITENTFINF